MTINFTGWKGSGCVNGSGKVTLIVCSTNTTNYFSLSIFGKSNIPIKVWTCALTLN